MADAGALEAKITGETVAAMKSGDKTRTGTLRLIKNALKNKAIEKREALTPPEEQQALASMIKQRRDSIEQFSAGNRADLVAIEAAEIAIIEEFLPRELDEAGLRTMVKETIAGLESTLGRKPGPRDMGAAMKAVQARIQAGSGRADGRLVSELVKAELAG